MDSNHQTRYPIEHGEKRPHITSIIKLQKILKSELPRETKIKVFSQTLVESVLNYG
jgi:hypothetical protein